jgi:hypothetical protein
MNQRTRDLLLLYGLALLVNGLVAVLVDSPGYVDAYYYFNGGHLLVEGHGLNDPYIWNYVYAPASLPAPAFTYWQPLPSLLAGLGIILFGRGEAFGAAQAVYVAAGSAVPLLSYIVASQIGERRHAWLAGLLTIFSGFYAIYWSLPESFTPFALSAGGALALAGCGRASKRWWVWALAGVCAGLAHLSRADGVLVLAVVVLAGLLPSDRKHPVPLRWEVLLALPAYLAVMSPWFVRNLLTFGSLQAPGGLATLWLTEYNDLFNYPSNLTASRYFSAGWGAILDGKWQALVGNAATFVAVQNLIFLTPFTLVGLWRRWRDDRFLPAVIYGAALFAAMTFAFSWPGVRGGWLHSGAALMPFLLPAGSLGLDDVIGWASERLRGWEADRAWRGFSRMTLLFAGLLTAFLILNRVVGLPDLSTVDWNEGDAVYDAIGARLDALGVPAEALVMSNNPPGFYTHTGRGGIPLPNGDEATLLCAADDYGAVFLIVDQNVPAGLQSLYDNGPASERLRLIEVFEGYSGRVYLYQIGGG